MNTEMESISREQYYMQRLEKFSFVLGIISIPLTLLSPFLAPCLLGSMAIVFAVLSKGGNLHFSRRSRIAAALGVTAITINVVLLVISLITMKELLSDPAGRQQLSDFLYQRYGMTLDELLSQLQLFEQ